MKSLIAALFVAILLACTQVTQTTGPTTVESEGAPETSAPAAKIGPSSPTGGTISLTPKSITVSVGSTVHVKVIITDAHGAEVDSESITTSVADSSVLRYTGTDARTLSFLGVKKGTTSVIVSAADLQASLSATVTGKIKWFRGRPSNVK